MRKICPVCRHNSAFQYNPPKLASLLDFPLSGAIHLKICLNCSFGWNVSSSLEHEYAQYYLDFNKHQVRSEFGRQVDNQYFSTVLDRIKSLLNKNIKNKIMDYGSGDRALADIAISLGFAEATCLDVGENDGMKNEYFQALACLHSLEHFYDPIKSVSEMNQMLCLGGILYISVPDAMRYEDTYYGAFNAVDLEHINHFTTKSLSTLLIRCGFEIINIKQSDRRVSEEAFYPEIWVSARKIASPKESLIQTTAANEKTTMDFLGTWKSYILKSNKEFEKLLIWTGKIIEMHSNHPIILYGLGSPALRIVEYYSKKYALLLGDSDIRLSDKTINQAKIQNLDQILKAIGNSDSHYIIAAVNGGRIKSYLQENGIKATQISIFEWDK